MSCKNDKYNKKNKVLSNSHSSEWFLSLLLHKICRIQVIFFLHKLLKTLRFDIRKISISTLSPRSEALWAQTIFPAARNALSEETDVARILR